MTIVLNSKGFKLPRLEREKFVNLMHLGLDYNRDTMLFSIKSYNNIEQVIDEVSAIMKDEVVFLQNCIKCSKAFPCKGCSYIEMTSETVFSSISPSL